MNRSTTKEISTGGNIIVSASCGIDVIAQTVSNIKEIFTADKNVKLLFPAQLFLPSEAHSE